MITSWLTTFSPLPLRIVGDFEALGMTASGKVQKGRLREHAVRELGLA